MGETVISVEQIRKLHAAHPDAWEPRNMSNPAVEQLIRRGFLRKVNGRCGFEAFKDSMLTWTDCARELFRPAAPSLPEATPEKEG